MRVLDALENDDLQSKASMISTSEALTKFLQRRIEVGELRGAVASGQVSVNMLREFVSRRLSSFEVGKRFPHEVSLAAIAVALERNPSEFAEEYISDLAGLEIRELPLAIRVGRFVLSRRRDLLSGLTQKVAILFPPFIDPNAEPKVVKVSPNKVPNKQERFILEKAV